MSSSRSKSASSAWRYSVPRPDEQRRRAPRRSVPSSWVPATRRSSRQRLERGHRRAVGVGRGQRVVDLGDRDDLRDRGICLAGQPVRVAAAVDALVVGADDLADRAVHADVVQQVGADLRVAADRRASRRPSSRAPRSMTRSDSANLPMSCSRPAVCASSWSRSVIPAWRGDVARERRHGGAVARGAVVALVERADEAATGRPRTATRTRACARCAVMTRRAMYVNATTLRTREQQDQEAALRVELGDRGDQRRVDGPASAASPRSVRSCPALAAAVEDREEGRREEDVRRQRQRRSAAPA